MLTELDVVNACLGKMGQAPVSSVNVAGPIVASARSWFQASNIQEQSVGWWFNREVIDFHANVDGYFYVPADVLSVRANPRQPYAIRDRRLYNTLEGSWLTGEPGDVYALPIVRLVDFEDLPIHAQNAIKYRTVRDFVDDFNGDQLKIVSANSRYLESLRELRAEQVYATQPNAFVQGPVAARRSRMKFPTSRGDS